MHDLTEGVRRFKRDSFPPRAELFAHLADHHRPTTLFIGCSDARVLPELICASEPGELFVIRTAGNLVPAHAPARADGIAASIEYAVTVLGVSSIVVCGHSACGAMTALAEGHDLTGAPAVADWLRHAAPPQPATATGAGAVTVDALIRRNVLAQLTNLAGHPSVARALAAGTVTLYGWVYDIATGTVERLDPATGRGTALAA
ncbi:carbonic anhydrase [Streptomyces sp. NBC_00963]|uniref:carbonic anhydrase n=1 Tax=unclassified Streptomyces TaxID=2593676 RepID=UPI002255545F|nr:carbonic anhydrase [Streptomyces sp. NBC_01306]MCX4723561.1 carbonic anhydrase [Streptomyces sp. NBC_01306]WSX44965.1 carbonic anhydrase [Streptomyces sp. NBC_00963]